MNISKLLLLLALLSFVSCKNEITNTPTVISALDMYTDSLFKASLDSTKSVGLDFGFTVIVGTYSGQTRGGKQSIEVKGITDAITIESNKDGNSDPLTTYIGNQTWMDGNDIITIRDDAYSIDHVYIY